MKIFAALVVAGLLWAGGAQAQDTAPQEQPLTISAEQTLEWHRDSKKYIARGNAVAAQGDVSIAAQSLTADYREGKESSMEIYRLTAEENVEIASQGNIATGQKAVYEVDSGKAVMTGDNLRLQSPDQIVTARERFEYDVTGGRLSAHGNAMVVRGQDNLSADMVAAVFAEDPVTKKRVLKELSAEGNVVIKTPTETVRGRSGIYDAASNIAVLRGNVRIERGPNVLEGAQAEVNLNTNVSRMIGGPEGQSGGRVRGVFYPGSKDGAAAVAPERAPLVQDNGPQDVVPQDVVPPQAPIKLIPPRPRMTAP